MYEGKPLLLVVGSTDTGRTPMAAALLRRALQGQAIVRSAGVLSHAGEAATPEAQMAVEQIDLDISRHIARPLGQEEHGQAELLLALDRGTEMVLFTMFPNDPRVACLSALAEQPDVLDPHRMPLGVWIAALRQLGEHVRAALPQIRQRLGLPAEQSDEQAATSKRAPDEPPLVPVGRQRTDWSNDEQMQRLLGLINSAAPPYLEDDAADVAAHDTVSRNGSVPVAEPQDAPEELADERAAQPDSTPDAVAPAPSRAEQVARMLRMLDVAAELPEIIDWPALRQVLIERLRAASQHSAGALDFAPAAVLMIEGKLAQHASLPHADALWLLRQSIARLERSLAADGLAAIGGDLGQW